MRFKSFLPRLLVEALIAGISILLYYLIFRFSIVIISSFHEWNGDLQRGILWYIYFNIYIFIICINGLTKAYQGYNLKNRIVINLIGLFILLLLSCYSFQFHPYGTLLPNFVAAVILLGEPIIYKFTLKKYYKK